jgi:hypothetical protein
VIHYNPAARFDANRLPSADDLIAYHRSPECPQPWADVDGVDTAELNDEIARLTQAVVSTRRDRRDSAPMRWSAIARLTAEASYLRSVVAARQA